MPRTCKTCDKPVEGIKRYCATCRRQRHLESHRRWYAANPDKALDANRRWRQTHPEQYRELKQRSVRKARALGKDWALTDWDKASQYYLWLEENDTDQGWPGEEWPSEDEQAALADLRRTGAVAGHRPETPLEAEHKVLAQVVRLMLREDRARESAERVRNSALA